MRPDRSGYYGKSFRKREWGEGRFNGRTFETVSELETFKIRESNKF